MNYSTYRFTLNMHSQRSQAYIKVFKGDTAVKLIMTLSDGGNLYKIGRGCAAWFAFRKPNIEEPIVHSCDIDGDCIIYTFDGTTADTVGVFECELTLVDDNGRVITAPKLVLDVAEKDVENDEDFPEFDENSKAIATVLGAVAKEDNREYQESIRQAIEEQRQANEVKRQESYTYAENTADEAKNIAESAVTTASEAKETADGAVETAESAKSKANKVSDEVDNIWEQVWINEANIGNFFETASLTYDNQTGKLKLYFDTYDGSVAVSVDLPLESSIVSIDEVEQDNKIYLKLTLASGNETLIELDDIIRGFVSKETFEAKISELTNAINGVEESLRQLNEGGIV